jgi:hypothetical protein
MQQPMLTLPQASKLAGKHEDTIRRLIKKLLKTDPQAAEKIKQEETVRGFHYLIDKEYLFQHLQPLQETPHQEADVTSESASNQPLHQPSSKGKHQPLQQGTHQPTYQPTHAELKAKDETIAILKKQLEQKDEQIGQLIERGTEANILLKGYQDKYLLNATNEHEVVDRKEAKPPDKRSQKSKPKKSEPPKRKGLFSFLRRK